MDSRAAQLRAGDFSHRLTLFAPAGTREVMDTNLATGVPARIQAMTAQQREQLAIGGIQGQTIYIVTIRYRNDVQSDLVPREECCTQRQFQILSLIPTDRREALEMTCVVGDR